MITYAKQLLDRYIQKRNNLRQNSASIEPSVADALDKRIEKFPKAFTVSDTKQMGSTTVEALVD